MDAQLILALVELAGRLVTTGTQLYEDSKATMSQTDAAAIKAKLAEVQALTASYRPLVDAALDAAANH